MIQAQSVKLLPTCPADKTLVLGKQASGGFAKAHSKVYFAFRLISLRMAAEEQTRAGKNPINAGVSLTGNYPNKDTKL